ncbi:hypothetical protein GCM10009665_58550 [Kitasatospora nipponensis]|uniref:Uncharacterized protein n=1 Tax=Kitasatospora nipponensis TaxID=258049 RepID=A0ABP4HFS3_9ACTN
MIGGRPVKPPPPTGQVGRERGWSGTAGNSRATRGCRENTPPPAVRRPRALPALARRVGRRGAAGAGSELVVLPGSGPLEPADPGRVRGLTTVPPERRAQDPELAARLAGWLREPADALGGRPESGSVHNPVYGHARVTTVIQGRDLCAVSCSAPRRSRPPRRRCRRRPPSAACP